MGEVATPQSEFSAHTLSKNATSPPCNLPIADSKHNYQVQPIDLQSIMAHVSRMPDWEELAESHIGEIQRTLPEPIRARATEVPVFFIRDGDEERGSFPGG